MLKLIATQLAAVDFVLHTVAQRDFVAPVISPEMEIAQNLHMNHLSISHHIHLVVIIV